MKKIIKPVKEFVSTIFTDIIRAKVDNRYLIFDNVFFIDEVGENYVKRGKNVFYALEIARRSNNEFTPLNIENILKQSGYSEKAKIWLFLVKNPLIFEKEIKDFSVYKESVYLFTDNLKIAKSVAEEFDVPLLSGLEIVKAVFDFSQINLYYQDPESYLIKPNVNYDAFPFLDGMRFGFKKNFAEAVYKLREFKSFVSNRVTFEFERDYYSLFSEKWRGYFCFYFDFNVNRIESRVKTLTNEILKVEKNAYFSSITKQFLESVKAGGKNDLSIFQSFALIDNYSVIPKCENLIGVDYVEKSLFRKDLIYKTPLLERDLDFDLFLPVKESKSFIKSIHKKHNLKTRRPYSIWGKDVSDNYVQFSFSESASPHIGVFAKTRSGKSFFIQKAISQIIRFNEETGKAGRIEEDNILIRYFDIGESARKFVTELKKDYPQKVLFFNEDLEGVKFSFLDVKDENGEISDDEIEFMINVMNMILELNKEESFKAGEKAEIIKGYRYLFKEKNYKGVPLKHLETIKGYESQIRKIYEKYPEFKNDSFAVTTDLPDDGEFDNLKKPLLEDLINYLEMKASSFTLTDIEKDSINNAIRKLKGINSIEMFKYYTSANIENYPFFYMELNSLKSLGEKLFIPAFWFIFKKLYDLDVKNAVEKKRNNLEVKENYYVIEEAHNFFKLKSFEDLFKVITREAAKYKIHLVLITQFVKDTPFEILKSLGSKIILPSIDPKEQVEDLKYLWGEREEYLKFFVKRAKRYTAFIEYDYGLLTVKLPISERERWLFNSEAL